MASPVPNFSFLNINNQSRQNSIVTFVVEGQEIVTETRFLLPCDYFNMLLNSGMQESQSGRIEVKEIPLSIFNIFLEYLKTRILPVLDFPQAKELLRLAHRYQHQALLNHVTTELQQAIPAQLKEVLQMACLYNIQELKQTCHLYARNNPHQFRALLSQSVDFGDPDIVEEILTWERNTLSQMMTYQDSDRRQLFSKLLEKGWIELADQFLQAGTRIGLSLRNLVPNVQEAIYQLLDQTTPLSPEQDRLLWALINNDPYCLTSNPFSLTSASRHHRRSPQRKFKVLPSLPGETPYPQERVHQKGSPLHVALSNGLDETFEKMVQLCSSKRVSCFFGPQEENLLMLAISSKKLPALQTLKRHCENLQSSLDYFTIYVLESIKTLQLPIVQAILAFPCRSSQHVDLKCIQAAIEIGGPKLLEILWPHYHPSSYELDQVREATYKHNCLDLAPIVFSGNFDASKEIYPSSRKEVQQDLPWLHYVAMKGNQEWVSFIIGKSRNVNATVEMYHTKYAEHGYPTTPLLLALLESREPPIILCFLASADVNIGNKITFPIHAICHYTDTDLLQTFLQREIDFEKKNSKQQNFFHLYFLLQIKLPLSKFLKLFKKVDVSCLKAKDAEGNTPLHYAIKEKRFQESYLMLIFDTSLLWAQNKEKKAPLRMLGGKEFEQALDSFVSQAISTANNKGVKRALLLWTAQNYLYSFCNRLIDAKADISVTQTGGIGLLHLACKAGSYLAVQKLLTLGLSVNSQDDQLTTPLHIAVEREDVQLATLLIEKGANPHAIDANGESPLSSALRKSAKEKTKNIQKIVEILEPQACKIQ